jgi:hypothetical protein
MPEYDDEKTQQISQSPQDLNLLQVPSCQKHDSRNNNLYSLHTLAASAHSTIHDDRDHDLEALERTRTPRALPVKVPRGERRGLFARFCLVAEVVEPWDYKGSTKWWITFVVAIAAAAAPVGTAIILREYTHFNLASTNSSSCS